MRFKLLRPTVNTTFHVDWSWFERNNLNAQSFIRNQLSNEAQQLFENGLKVREVDYIDPESGEVFRMDNMREMILARCQWEPNYITSDMPLVQSVFRLFLANNNKPMTIIQLAQGLGRHNPQAILRVRTGSGVQNGIVPAHS